MGSLHILKWKISKIYSMKKTKLESKAHVKKKNGFALLSLETCQGLLTDTVPLSAWLASKRNQRKCTPTTRWVFGQEGRLVGNRGEFLLITSPSCPLIQPQRGSVPECVQRTLTGFKKWGAFYFLNEGQDPELMRNLRFGFSKIP